MQIERKNGGVRGVVAVTTVLASALGCVSADRERSLAAQRAYEDCVAQHGEGAETCRALQDAARVEYERYERKAQRHWRQDDPVEEGRERR